MSPENVYHSVSIIRMIADLPAEIDLSTGMPKQGKAAQANASVATGTCFFYARGERRFIVTNRHVLDVKTPRAGQQIPAKQVSIQVRLRAGNSATVPNPLKQQNEPLWKSHANSDVDVALLPFTPPSDADVHFWSSADFLPEQYALELAEPVICVGYPMAFCDKLNNRPILRHGSIATEYGINFLGKPYFLTDAVHFHGNSGTPVITRERREWRGKDGGIHSNEGPECYLLGVHSRREYVQEKPVSIGIDSQDDLIDLGLGATWYAHLIEEIAAMF
ncbi:MAG: serine protease [Isosphaeraceae bacterium]